MVLPFKGVFYEMNSMFSAQGTTAEGRKCPCADFELNAAECLEAYGLVRGAEKCVQFIDDARECKYRWMSRMRYMIMRQERYRKIVKGEIPITNRWGKPYPYDSFVAGGLAP